MLLKKITLKNIRSYEYQELEFGEGSTLLSGDIGSGKTSILLGIEFALFGLQPGQRGSSLLRNGENYGGVIIELEIDGKDIVVERTLKRGKTISQDYSSITVDGVKKEISVTELKNKVLELLNYPKEFSKKQNFLYKFTVYTPQEEMKQIILQDPDTRINTLRHVFGIDKYKKILENISIFIIKIREEKRIKEGATLNLEQDKINLISKENELESKLYNLSSIEKEFFEKKESRKKIEEEKEEISEKIEEKNNLQKEIEKTNIMVLNKKEIISNNIKTITQIKEQIEELNKMKFDESKINFLHESISSLKKDKEKMNKNYIDINSHITSLNLKNEESNSLSQRLSNLEICPTCLQSIDSLYRANVLNNLHSDISKNKEAILGLEIQKKEIYEKISSIDMNISLREREATTLEILKVKLQEINEKQLRLNELEKAKALLEKDIHLLNQHNETLKKNVLEMEKFDKLYKLKQEQLADALELEKLAEIKKAELKKEIDVFSFQIHELKDKIKDTEEIKKKMDYLSKIEDWISKKFISLISFIEKNVMIKLKNEFSQLFAQWFSMLVSDSFNVYLSDDFTPILEQQDYEIDYAYLSGGERTAVALAYRLSLNQVINSLLSKIKTKDIVILDEPTDGFSQQQLDRMREVFQQINIKQLIIVSHEQKIEDFVEKVTRLDKKSGISRIHNND